MNSLIQKARTGIVTLAGTALYGINTAMAASGFGEVAPDKIAEAGGGESSITVIVLTVVNYFLGFLGLIAVLMVIYAGVLILTSAGNPEQAGKGKKILLYAALGILIIILSFAFVSTIFGAASGQEG